MGITALVLEDKLLESNFGFKPNVDSSISENLGVAFTKRTEFAVEIKEKDGTITSSPDVIPYESNVACSADVPEFKQIQ